MLSAKLLQLMEHFDATLIREIPRLHSHAVEREANEAKQQPPPLRRRRGEDRRGGGGRKKPNSATATSWYIRATGAFRPRLVVLEIILPLD